MDGAPDDRPGARATEDDGEQVGLDRQYRVLIDHSPDAIVVHEGNLLVFVNPAGQRLIGATRADQVVGHPFSDFVDQQSMKPLLGRISSLDHEGAASEPTEMELRRIDGRHVEVEARSVLTIWAGQRAYLAILRDLTAQKAAETAAMSAERQFTTVVSTLLEGVIILDRHGVVKSINAAASTILGIGDEIVDATGPDRLRHRLTTTSADGRMLTGDDYPYVLAQRTGSPAAFTNCIHRPDGTAVWIRGTTQRIFSGPAQRLVVSFTDITSERANNERLEYQATHDALTGLPNRGHIVDTLRATLDNLERGPTAVLFIDLDDLKTINDTHGHTIGDDVLKTVATRLHTMTPDASTVGRIGGDEFVAIIKGNDGFVDAITAAIHTTLTEHIKINNQTLKITASIGVVQLTTDDHSRTVDDLLHDADHAMYAAKTAGGKRTTRHPPPTHPR